MLLAKRKNRALISAAAALLFSELLFIMSDYRYRINWFVLGIIFYFVMTFGFSWYLRYKMHKEIMQESDEEILDDILD
ncbi:MAG: putative membrane protein YqjE [Crocinitomix sp.]|jgi:uncharacterized membrane protein YqjE